MISLSDELKLAYILETSFLRFSGFKKLVYKFPTFFIKNWYMNYILDYTLREGGPLGGSARYCSKRLQKIEVGNSEIYNRKRKITQVRLNYSDQTIHFCIFFVKSHCCGGGNLAVFCLGPSDAVPELFLHFFTKIVIFSMLYILLKVDFSRIACEKSIFLLAQRQPVLMSRMLVSTPKIVFFVHGGRTCFFKVDPHKSPQGGKNRFSSFKISVIFFV